jgi:hypothetical protein
MIRSRMVLVATLWIGLAPVNSTGAADFPDHSTEVKRLMTGAKEKGERELDLVWSGTSLGGSEGAKKFEAVFNRMYGLNVKFNFTPGPSMTNMAGTVTQEVAAGRKTSTDILMGTESHYGELLRQKTSARNFIPSSRASRTTRTLSRKTRFPGSWKTS